MTTTPLIDGPATGTDVSVRLAVADRQMSQLERDLRALWHDLVAVDPVVAARVRVAANHLRNAATALGPETTP